MSEGIDHRALLKRYMENVAWHEGVYFIPPPSLSSVSGGPWTDEEVAELETIARELDEAAKVQTP